MNKNRHTWYGKDTRTITLGSTYLNFDDFVVKSGIDGSNEDYKNVFNTIYNLYNDNYTIYNTEDYLSQWLRYNIENEVEKYNKTNEIWDNQIDKLFGKYEELNQFNIGDIKKDIDDFDKYKSARQTKQESNDILNKIKDIQEMKTPFDNLIKSIANKILQQFEVETI